MTMIAPNSAGSDFVCELCGQRLAEHLRNTRWGTRHCCTACAESLPGSSSRDDEILEVDVPDH